MVSTRHKTAKPAAALALALSAAAVSCLSVLLLVTLPKLQGS